MRSNRFTQSLPLTLLAVLLAAGTAAAAHAQTEPLAATPPMGWNNFNHFQNHVDDGDVRAAADAMVASGMRDAGYIYVNIDAFWEGPRDAQGNITSNARFPDMKALADYIHSKGLKFGLYSVPGPTIEQYSDYAGSYKHEQQDADTYAKWGVDYLKYDLMTYGRIMKNESGGDPEKGAELMKQAYERMHQALVKTGRPIVFSLCQYGFDAVWKWGPQVGANLWRTTGDVSDNYYRMAEIGFSQAGLAPYAGPGHWNDPDMLEVGNGGMSPDEYRTHMSLWSILAAPLIAGNDLTKMTDETRSILINKEVIAVDQDKLGIQGDRVHAEGPYEVWMKPLSDGAKAVALFNRNGYPYPMTVDFSTIGFNGPVQARDLWAHKDLGSLSGSYTVSVAPHGVVMLRLSQ
ncbi:MAG: glycoside hydrolase family 27 protein [Terracidiphilus sp.]|jgi:alpha-galactosidase